MNKDLLIENISKLLNLAESEKEFAFRKTIEKVSEKLKYDEALRINKLGVFQLKKEPMPRYERSNLLPSAPKEKRTLVYSPPFENLEGDIKSLFLTLDLDDLNLTINDDVDKVFSISVNKPLIPISENVNDSAQFEETFTDRDISADLEHKISQLVDSAVILKNYDIWEDYLNRKGLDDEQQKPLDDDIDLNDLMFNESFTKANVNSDNSHVSTDNAFVPPLESPMDDDLKAFEEAADIERKFGNTIDQEIENLPPKSKMPLGLDDDDEENTIEDPLVGLQNLNEELKAINVGEPEDYDSDPEGFDEFEMPSNLELDDTLDEKERIDEAIDEETNDSEIEQKAIDEKPDAKDSSVFDEIEDFLEADNETKELVDEIVEGEDKPADEFNIVDASMDNESDQDSEVEETTDSIIEPVTAATQISDDEETPFYKKSVIIYSSVAAVLAIILILIFFPGGEDNEPTLVQPTNESAAEVQTIPEQQIEDQKPASTPPAEVSKPVSERTGLYRKIGTDAQAANQIYFDGEVYTVQVSSWRSATIAEREVARLKNAGHDAFIYQVFLESKGSTWNRVRIGYFTTLEDAEDFLVKNKF